MNRAAGAVPAPGMSPGKSPGPGPGPASGAARTAARGRGAIRAALVVAALVGVGNYSELLVPKAFASAQQFVSLAMWLAMIGASFAVRPAARPAPHPDLWAACLFFGLAAVSVLWSELLAASILKSLALVVTTYAAYRVALCLPVREIVGCVTLGLVLQAAASVVLALAVPQVGVVQAWMHNGQWSGLFESKQTLGSVGAFLIFFAGYRKLQGGGALEFLVSFGLAAACAVGSGSRGGGATALAAILLLVLTRRSRTLTGLFAFAPALMIALAYALLFHLYQTDRAYFLVGGERVDLTERTFIWHHALHRFDDAPILGTGINGFWSDRWIAYAFEREHGWVLDNFHSGYLTILIETGLLGACLFTAWFVSFGARVAFVPRPATLSESDYRLIVSYMAMMFFFDVTETYFLRSTNVITVLMTILYFKTVPVEAPGRGVAGRGARAMIRPPPARLRAGLAALATLAALAGPAAAETAAGKVAGAPGRAPAEEPAAAAARRMGAGVNILGYDGVWEGGTDAPFRDRYFGLIARAGFRHVRINLHAFKYIDAAGRLDPALLERLDRVLDRAIAAGLIPVVDEHDFDVCQTDAATCRTKLRIFWRAVSARYAGRYPEAVFEVLNEPGGTMSLATWNDILAEMLAIIRRTHPDRTVVVAALNTEAPLAERLPRLPEADRNLILTVHYYQPMRFTHQGAAWAPEFRSDKPVDWGGPDDRARMTRDFEAVAAWAGPARRPVYLGEFGVYDAAPAASRARWLGHAAATARRLGWPFAVWQFDHDFALYDTDRERWNAPALRALMPDAPPAGR